jgi:hypothetical protein
MAHDSHAITHAKTLPADLSAPAFVDGWKNRATMVAAIFLVLTVILAFLGQAQDGLGWEHFMRAWTLGLMLTFGWTVGGLALLMVQYCSGGKWGLLLRRPLEAMSRCLPVVFVYWAVPAVSIYINGIGSKLYLWAQYTTDADTSNALKSGVINEVQAHCLDFKRGMLNPTMFIII